MEAEGGGRKERFVLSLYFMFDKATLTCLGSSTMSYYILTSVVYVVKKALAYKDYKLEGTLTWQEVIAN